jgi:hypothetical protein
MSIFNSVTRGFGLTLGRRAANSLLDGSNKQKVYRVSASLTFWQGIKTILWFLPMMLVSGLIVYIGDIFTHGDEVLKKGHGHFNLIVIIAIIFTIIIGNDYYQNNKKNLI